MTLSINLTVVLVTFIICAFLYAMCRLEKKTKKQETKGEQIQLIDLKPGTITKGIIRPEQTQNRGKNESGLF